jgi:hypothetical protein
MAIHKKLLEFQKLGVTLKRDGTNPAFGRGSKYVTLNEVLDKVKEPLNKVGIVIVQQPSVIADRAGLHTVLMDTEDDTHVESFIPYVNPADMQKLGGAITYARRYSLIALLGLEDEDDDGNQASGKKAAGVGDMTTDPLKDDFNL